jgi:hypothetical protein
MKQHFVTFYSPGTFMAEQTTEPIAEWDTDAAMKLADKITERHGATPYGFRFSTRSRGDADLDSKVTKESPLYYLGGTVETLAEVEARNDPSERILVANMKCNRWKRIVINTNSYRWTQPLNKGDVVLEYTPPTKRKKARTA